MKSERITVLSSPEFKAYLVEEAAKAGISLSELIRRRCAKQPTADEAQLLALTSELQKAVKEARNSLLEGLASVQDALQQGKEQRVA